MTHDVHRLAKRLFRQTKSISFVPNVENVPEQVVVLVSEAGDELICQCTQAAASPLYFGATGLYIRREGAWQRIPYARVKAFGLPANKNSWHLEPCRLTLSTGEELELILPGVTDEQYVDATQVWRFLHYMMRRVSGTRGVTQC